MHFTHPRSGGLMVARYRVTVRGYGVDLLGYVVGTGRLEELAEILEPAELMVDAFGADEGDEAQ